MIGSNYNIELDYEYGNSNHLVEWLCEKFENHFSNLGYKQLNPVTIISGIDSTVRFIGSHISVMKPLFLEDNIPNEGIYLIQDCLRTRNLKIIFDDNASSNWGSYFKSMGCLTQPIKINSLVHHLNEFLITVLKIDETNIKIRINTTDADLMEIALEYFPNSSLEIDTIQNGDYRHKLGIENVIGRNFNIALRHAKTNLYAEIGNIIIIERNGKPLGIELALGTSTILQLIYGKEHVYDFFPLGIEKNFSFPNLSRKLEDAIITSTVLLKEGLIPGANNNRRRILRTYLRAIIYHRLRLGISLKEIKHKLEIADNFIYPQKKMAVNPFDFIIQEENKFKIGKINKELKEDKIISQLIQELL